MVPRATGLDHGVTAWSTVEMDDKKPATAETTTTKAVWEAPTIEEIDYVQTEASYAVPGLAEAAIYTN